jgi:type VI secretion system secreted protein Hcp
MKKVWVIFIGLTLFFSSSGIAFAAADMILKIDGIDGESVIDGHEDEIDVLAWSWGIAQSGSLHFAEGGFAGKADVQDVSLTKYIDKASVDLMLACLKGEHIKEAVLTVRKAGQSPIDYLVITMSPVLVSSVSNGGSTGYDRLTENVTLNFAKIKVSYTPQKADGSADAAIDFTWNIEQNYQE